MRVSITVSLGFLILSLFMVNASAQQASDPPGSVPPPAPAPGERSTGDLYMEMVNRALRPPPRVGPSPEPRVVKKGLLAPSVEDDAAYEAFLKQPDTGMIRLLPREVYERLSSKERKTIGAGEYYSFTYLAHESGQGLDLSLDAIHHWRGSIELPPDYILSAAHDGMLTNLGEVPLESLTTNDPRLNFMLTFEPSRSVPQRQCEHEQFQRGISLDGLLYRKFFPVTVNATYLLRSVNYGFSDLLVAFRVVRLDSDNSVTIAWKLLKKFPPRYLERVFYVNNPTNRCPPSAIKQP